MKISEKFVGLASCAIPTTNKSDVRSYSSTNELIIPSSNYYYSYSNAGKTGFTSQAKYCLVSTAYKNNLELICVVLGENDSSTRFITSKQLFEYGFENYSIQTIFHKGDIATNIIVDNGSKETKNLDLIISDNISALLKNNALTSDLNPEITLNNHISAPINEGEVIGEISYTIDGNVYRSSLLASHEVKESEILQFVFYIIIGILLCIISIIILSKTKE